MAGHHEGHPPIARLDRRAIGQATAHPTLHVRSVERGIALAYASDFHSITGRAFERR
jgi:hypothetical protein